MTAPPFQPGDDVVASFDGEDHDGEYVQPLGSGFHEILILTDPENDYGSLSDRLAPISIVAVRSTHLRKKGDNSDG